MPRTKKVEAKESAQDEELPKWAEDEIKSAKFGQPEVILRAGYILEIYEEESRLDIQVYEPMPDGRTIVEGITMPKSTKVNDLMKGFVYEFKINFYSAPLSDKVEELLKAKFSLDMKAIYNFDLQELALMDVESDLPSAASSSSSEAGEED